MFTKDNTENFTQKVLDKMNNELETELAKLDKDALSYDDEVKSASDKIFNKYC